MNSDTQDLFDQAMSLPADTRELLAAQLMGSLEPSEGDAAEIRQAWAAEIERRIKRLESGETQAIPIEEAWPNLARRPWKKP